jgi:hypothetical protein
VRLVRRRCRAPCQCAADSWPRPGSTAAEPPLGRRNGHNSLHRPQLQVARQGAWSALPGLPRPVFQAADGTRRPWRGHLCANHLPERRGRLGGRALRRHWLRLQGRRRERCHGPCPRLLRRQRRESFVLGRRAREGEGATDSSIVSPARAQITARKHQAASSQWCHAKCTSCELLGRRVERRACSS